MIDLDDIQGLVRRGYGQMTAARYLLLQVRNPAAAQAWLGRLAADVTHAGTDPSTASRLNIAFSFDGLTALELDAATLDAFPVAFREGMATPDRSRGLGDTGNNAPARWQWGGPDNAALHICLLVYAVDQPELERRLTHLRQGLDTGGLHEVHALETGLLDGREHFGFRDGIGQPAIHGIHRGGRPDNTIAAGEILLGHPGQQGRLAPGSTPFTNNGSFLVIRQLRQHVQRFWQFLNRQCTEASDLAPTAQIRLATKMVGRWPSGAPLARFPDADPATSSARDPASDSTPNFDDFAYATDDPHGDRCPIGAHVRRCNPRDSLAPGPDKSLENALLHRILRRGRPYGQPVTPSLTPAELITAPDDDLDRGLQFVCLNANLTQQFEFVQQNWIHNIKFEGQLYDESDPIAGIRQLADRKVDGFTIQGKPVRRQLDSLPEFVTVQGGAYWFLPGLHAISRLART